jgi:hypothetical protein
VALVGIPCAPHATGKLDAACLLHRVRCLVRRGVQVGFATKCDRPSRGVGIRAEAVGRHRCGATDLGLDVADVVPAEQVLDRARVGQRLAGTGNALRGGLLRLLGVHRSRDRATGLHLHGLRGLGAQGRQTHGQGLLAGHWMFRRAPIQLADAASSRTALCATPANHHAG